MNQFHPIVKLIIKLLMGATAGALAFGALLGLVYFKAYAAPALMVAALLWFAYNVGNVLWWELEARARRKATRPTGSQSTPVYGSREPGSKGYW